MSEAEKELEKKIQDKESNGEEDTVNERKALEGEEKLEEHARNR